MHRKILATPTVSVRTKVRADSNAAASINMRGERRYVLGIQLRRQPRNRTLFGSSGRQRTRPAARTDIRDGIRAGS